MRIQKMTSETKELQQLLNKERPKNVLKAKNAFAGPAERADIIGFVVFFLPERSAINQQIVIAFARRPFCSSSFTLNARLAKQNLFKVSRFSHSLNSSTTATARLQKGRLNAHPYHA